MNSAMVEHQGVCEFRCLLSVCQLSAAPDIAKVAKASVTIARLKARLTD